MFNNGKLAKVTIIGLGLYVLYLKAEKKAIREFTSEEKLNLFNICVELALDVKRLENQISQLANKE